MALTLTRRPDQVVHLWHRGEYLGAITNRPGRLTGETKLIFDMPLAVKVMRAEVLDFDPRTQPVPPPPEAADPLRPPTRSDDAPERSSPEPSVCDECGGYGGCFAECVKWQHPPGRCDRYPCDRCE